MFRIICLLIGYVFGMFQTSYIVGRMNGIDIREHGSKNAGFTNTNRVLGMKKGIIVFVIDIFKAIAAFVVATLVYNHFFAIELFSFVTSDGYVVRPHFPYSLFAGGTFFASYHVLPGLYAGIGAILGHCFPFYLKFRGGKGVACALGLIIMLDWRITLISFTIGLIAVLITKFISVASLLITLSVPILMFLLNFPVVVNGISPQEWHSLGFTMPDLQSYFRNPVEGVWLMTALCAFVWFLHRDNIKRLLSGTENKFSFKRKVS